MSFHLEYYDNFSLAISKVSVITEFNEKIIEERIMKKFENKWITSFDLNPGEYLYKFLINDKIRLNDPFAKVYIPNKKGELLSYLKINEEGKRLYSSKQYYVNVNDYLLSSVVTDRSIDIKKNFNLNIDKKIVARFQFDIVTGIHTATVVWFNPKGEVFSWVEEMLFKSEKCDINPVILWFWFDLNSEILEGKWFLKLYIDGEYLLEDSFYISRMYIYSKILIK